MIELTENQRRQLDGSEPVVIDPETKVTYVLVRKELFDRIRHAFGDDILLGKREVAVLVERAMQEYDADDPALHLYQHD